MSVLRGSQFVSAVDLNGSWCFAFSDERRETHLRSGVDVEGAGLTVRAGEVPGNLELDLQRAGLIDDPFVGMNVVGLRKFESCHVWYWRRFDAKDRPGHDALLVFEGIDCLADVFLNGERVGSSDNMLVEHIFDVTGKLVGDNELLVHIRPAVEEAKRYEYPPGVGANPPNVESLYVRKAPHMYGWDIMPRVLSGGLWRPVGLVFRPVERFESVFLATRELSSDLQKAELALHYRARTTGGAGDSYEVRVDGSCGSSSFSAGQCLVFEAGRISLGVEEPVLWWPRGRGEPNLYDVTVKLFKNGEQIDGVNFHHGIRTVELLRSNAELGEGKSEFCFKINDERVFIRGTNWVPLDAFHSRDLERTERAIELAEELECNMIRCWGGNVYESDLFFDLCDRKGMLVWQDFAMACAVYPQDQEFQDRLADEVRKVVRRLRQHPSLALWSGDNECDWAYEWQDRGDPNNNVLTRQLLPSVLREEDPTRCYLPSSPYIDPYDYKTNKEFLPEHHLWGPRDYFKGDFYIKAHCHFVSEIGYHGCPEPASLGKFLSAEKVWPWQDNEEWKLHGTNPVPELSLYAHRVELMAKQVREFFGQVPETLEDFVFASQAVQAEAKKFFIEWFRQGKWRRTGILWWNLIDGWPQFSDAVVDYYWQKKLAYHFIRTSQQLVCLVLGEPEGQRQQVLACNDTRQDVPLEFTVRDVVTDQIVSASQGVAAADGVTPLAEIPFAPDQQRFCLIEWQSAAGKSSNHYLAGQRPFDLGQYRRWLAAARLYPEVSIH